MVTNVIDKKHTTPNLKITNTDMFSIDSVVSVGRVTNLYTLVIE